MTDDSFQELLAIVWRELGRHTSLDQAWIRVAQTIGQTRSFAYLGLRLVDAEHATIATLAAADANGWPVTLAPARPVNRSPEFEQLLDWLRIGAPLGGPYPRVQGRVPGLLPGGLTASTEVAVMPLHTISGQLGALVLVSAPGVALGPDVLGLLQALLEPTTVALAQYERFAELEHLREAAEAERGALLTRLGRDIHDQDAIIGADTGLRIVLERASLVARSDAPVLILGETGAGKEVIARQIHQRSARAEGPFLRVNCGAIPSELIDSELFGHERGSFTGATAQRQGWFERADRGTLFLDEIGELSLDAQVRLLRILQDGTFQRVGGQSQLHVDVRLIAATHRALPEMVQDGQFREDLWYRIAVFPIALPALRERKQDIPALATHFAVRAAKRYGLRAQLPTPQDEMLLLDYAWPGNVRELASVIERAALLGEGRRLEVGVALGFDAPTRVPQPATPVAGSAAQASFETLDRVIAAHIEQALQRTEGRIEGRRGAARLLGLNPHTLRSKMRKLGVDWRRFRGSLTDDTE